jgi:hypothetical protein
MALLIPSWAELAGWGGVLAMALLFIGLGRLLAGGRVLLEAALVAGWGGAALLLTLWGVATSATLALPALLVLLLGALGALLPRRAFGAADGRALLRLLVVSLPLLAVMASARPSLPDTFLNLLPNAVYLWDHGVFPADDRWPSYSLLPGAPYNLQLAAYVASLLARRLALNAMIGFNLVLQLAMALFLARLVARREDDGAAPPSWGAVAAGLLLATLINPGFVPRYDLSGYSEASVSVVTGFAGWFAARALDALAAGRSARRDLVLLALALAALVNIKQDSVALAAALLASSCGLVLLQERETRRRTLLRMLLAGLPAALLYVAWRFYVLEHFAVGELKLLPFRQWQFALIPQILRSMAVDIAAKAYFFAAAALAVTGLVRHARRHGLDLTVRLAALFAGVALLYNGAIFFTYVAHFGGAIGASAHSYFRYNTHLGPLMMIALVLLGRALAAERGSSPVPAWRRAAPALAIVLALISPLAFFGFLRFDLEATQERAWLLARSAAPALMQDRRLALLLPGDNGSLEVMLAALIRFAPPRHPDAELEPVERLTPETLDALAAKGVRFALLSCAPAGFDSVAPGQGALLALEGSRWRPLARWSYPKSGLPVRRTHVVAEEPLCLPRG